MLRRHLKDLTWLRVCFTIAHLGTCKRRQVGAVFLDASGRVLCTGFNGVAPNRNHCTDAPCAGAGCPSGTGLELCEAIHAEQNAMAQLQDLDRVHTVYCTDSPCIHCVKMLAVTSAKRIVFAREYPHPAAKEYWVSHGGLWDHVPLPDTQQEPPKASKASNLYSIDALLWGALGGASCAVVFGWWLSKVTGL